MAVNFTDFTNAPVTKSPLRDLLSDVLSAYQAPKKAAQAQEAYDLQKRQQELANKFKETQIENEPGKQDLERRYKEALIGAANRRGIPGSGTGAGPKPTGDYATFILAHPNATPEEKQAFADKLLDAKLRHLNSSTARSETLNETQATRDRSPLGKVEAEYKEVQEGKFPGTQEKLTPEVQKKLSNDYLLDMVKKTTDPAIRARLLNASNMNITLADINAKDLTQYSGIVGKADKIGDSLKSGLGEDNPKYNRYITAVTSATAAAKQMRQYLGDSIQPSAQAKLEELAKPESWNVTQAQAEANFNYIRDLYKRETNTLIRAATDASIYTAEGNSTVAGEPVPTVPGQNSGQGLSAGGFDFSKFPVKGR
jgi:hypothetical protein